MGFIANANCAVGIPTFLQAEEQPRDIGLLFILVFAQAGSASLDL